LCFSAYLSLGCALIPALAISTPTFPICSNPQGELIVRYDSGVHGIVGSSLTYTGSDAVYRLTDVTLLQCFCDESSNWTQVESVKPRI
jgi:hypothetical protein